MYYKLTLIEVEKFLKYSSEIGSDFMLCQGPGGNTSFKKDGLIYIKKSGFHLSKSTRKSFQEIDYKSILSFYKKNMTEGEKYSDSLSIETPLHVLLKAKYVFHYHSIASIICSLIIPKSTLDSFLRSKKIMPIKYIRPGINLAREVQKNNLKNSQTSFFLYNHGMVVEGNNLKELKNRIFEIEDCFNELIDYEYLLRLKKVIFETNQNNLQFLNPDSSIQYEQFEGKFFFPDHAVFFPYALSRDENAEIFYNQDNIIFKKQLSVTEMLYFKTLLIIFSYIKNKKIYNHIDHATSNLLRSADDEILRKNINK
jgi:ribulose-5-phosphate 4-epimerase/fuculose-1-phosphate aldolase